jgi:hypothetical protein
MVKVKSQEEVIVITRKVEQCQSLAQLSELFEASRPHTQRLIAAFRQRIRQLDRK